MSTTAARWKALEGLRAKDEAFWQVQERAIQGALGQPCCTLSGISTGLMALPGRFAVVIHGEEECAACFRHGGPSNIRFYCTGLTEAEFVTGRTAGPLRRCLTLVAEEMKPDAVFVLGACPVEVIGDRFETVVDEVGRAYPHIAFRALHTSGLKTGTQSAMLDWMFETLASLPAQPLADELARWDAPDRRLAHDAPSERSVNFLGVPYFELPSGRGTEARRALESAGLTLVGAFPGKASLSQWRVVRHAKATFVADRSLYPKLTRSLEAGGQQVLEVPVPVGVGPTAELYDRIGAVYGVETELRAATAQARERAETAVATFKARFGGTKLAYGLRMTNNYQADLLAYQGLGDRAALMELGLDVVLLIQGPPDKRAQFQGLLERRNIDLPFEMFLEPWVLADILRRGGFGLACVADHVRNEAAKAGVPMFISRTLEPWFEGVESYTDKLTRLLVDAARGKP